MDAHKTDTTRRTGQVAALFWLTILIAAAMLILVAITQTSAMQNYYLTATAWVTHGGK